MGVVIGMGRRPIGIKYHCDDPPYDFAQDWAKRLSVGVGVGLGGRPGSINISIRRPVPVHSPDIGRNAVTGIGRQAKKFKINQQKAFYHEVHKVHEVRLNFLQIKRNALVLTL